MLASLEEGVAATRRVAQGIEGHLRLSFIHITPYAHVLQALRAFRAASPAVQFTLREASTQQQVEWLEQGEVDIALLRAPGRSTPGLRFERLSGEDILVALPSGPPLRGAGEGGSGGPGRRRFRRLATRVGPGFS